MGSPFLYIDWIVCKVTFLRAMAGGEPMGEWEEYRTCNVDGALWWLMDEFGDDEIHGCVRADDEKVLNP